MGGADATNSDLATTNALSSISQLFSSATGAGGDYIQHQHHGGSTRYGSHAQCYLVVVNFIMTATNGDFVSGFLSAILEIIQVQAIHMNIKK